ncbi:MAG: hypothetical protein ACXVBR_14005 [Flavisolibacter sp.]
MSLNPTSRRSFLGSMAILSAGAAFGSAASVISGTGHPTDLRKEWSDFCFYLGGLPSRKPAPLEKDPVLASCKGHTHQTGDLVHFRKDGLLAQPTWIFWDREKSHPSDVVITFFEEGDLAKAFRINRFELQGIKELARESKAGNLLSLLHQEANKKENAVKGPRNLDVRTCIVEGRKARVHAILAGKEEKIEKKLTYHI